MQHNVLDQFVTHHETIVLSQNLLHQFTNNLESLGEMSLDTLRLLNRPESIQALRSGSFTVTDLVGMEDTFIEVLLWPLCLEALFFERTTIDLLKELTAVELHAANVEDNYPTHSLRPGE